MLISSDEKTQSQDDEMAGKEGAAFDDVEIHVGTKEKTRLARPSETRRFDLVRTKYKLDQTNPGILKWQ